MTRSTIMPPEGIAQLCRAMPPSQTQRWTLLYGTESHGKSFQRFLSSVVRRGPTVVLIKEKGGKVLGGIAPVDWRTPADRFDDDDGPWDVSTRNRPANQHEAFYGTHQGCFVFRWDTRDFTTWRPRPHVNSNYQYMCDRHSDEEKVGVGMGGHVGHHAWFLDKWMERGYCKGEVCTTFGNSRLSDADVFDIEAVEVWGVDPSLCDTSTAGPVSEVTGERLTFARRQTKAQAGRDGKVLTGMHDGVEATKALLRLNGTQFYSDDV